MRHIPFLRALANIPDRSAEWNIVSLGYLTLHSFDLWCEVGHSDFVMYEAVTTIRSRIEALPNESPYKSIYTHVSHTLSEVPDWNAKSVVAPLLAYADLLERESQWMFAVDTYKTVADAFDRFYCDTLADAHTQCFARVRQAFSMRSAGKLDSAELTYNQALVVAKRWEDAKSIHNSFLGLASVHRAKGNLSKSLKILTGLLADWKRGLYRVDGGYSRILQNRAATYAEMEDYDQAILDYLAAYKDCIDEDNRVSILGDLGACAIENGDYEFGHNVLSLVLRTSPRAHQKQFTILNLLYLAIMQNDKPGFEYYRQMWQPEICGDVVNSHAYLFLAEAAEKFGTHDQAITAYQKAASIAEQAQIHTVQLKALKRLDDIRSKGEGSGMSWGTFESPPGKEA